MTKIEWAEKTWSPITGCTPISEGCAHCYAKRMAQRMKGRYGYPEDEPFKVTFHPDKLSKPSQWKKPSMIFVCSMGDLFHEDVTEKMYYDVLHTCFDNPQHTFLFLTKRPERMRDLAFKFTISDNIWFGVTAENQRTADERIPILLDIPAKVRFVSVGPMLERIVIPNIKHLDWIICGAETGNSKRWMNPEWALSLKDQCKDTGVSLFFKKDGEGKRLLDGQMYEEYPVKLLDKERE